MEKITQKFYLALGIAEKNILAINKELSIPVEFKLSPFARTRRVEMTTEAIGWPKGKNQEKRTSGCATSNVAHDIFLLNRELGRLFLV